MDENEMIITAPLSRVVVVAVVASAIDVDGWRPEYLEYFILNKVRSFSYDESRIASQLFFTFCFF